MIVLTKNHYFTITPIIMMIIPLVIAAFIFSIIIIYHTHCYFKIYWNFSSFNTISSTFHSHPPTSISITISLIIVIKAYFKRFFSIVCSYDTQPKAIDVFVTFHEVSIHNASLSALFISRFMTVATELALSSSSILK